MAGRNPLSLWNPADSVQITPGEYELQVLQWIRASAGPLIDFDATHLKSLDDHGGEYEFDVVVEFSVFEGAKIIVLAECKRYSKPVERDKVLALHAKVQDTAAHKGIMFSTSGFQRGASGPLVTHLLKKGRFCPRKERKDTEKRNRLWSHAFCSVIVISR